MGYCCRIAFFPKKSIEKETQALEYFDISVSASNPLVVYTDHHPLLFLQWSAFTNCQLLWWSLALQKLPLEIQLVSGKENTVAHCLSQVVVGWKSCFCEDSIYLVTVFFCFEKKKKKKRKQECNGVFLFLTHDVGCWSLMLMFWTKYGLQACSHVIKSYCCCKQHLIMSWCWESEFVFIWIPTNLLPFLAFRWRCYGEVRFKI